MTDTGGTRLAMAVAPLVAAHPGKSGIHALTLATDAFAARMLLAGAAQRSLDVQYYIWRGDQTGMLMFEALAEAARRGVRVRVLIDDQNTRGIEKTLAALGSIAGFEARLYNPFASRHARFLDYAGDFARMNRRMHNKAFIADGQAAVIGGRNIGNEYFGAGMEVPFKDLDVLAIGSAVRDISGEFDLYWNSPSAYPVAITIGPPPPGAGALLDREFSAARADPESVAYIAAVRRTPLVSELLEQRLPLEWADARLVSDDPAKTLDKESRTELLLLSELLGGATRPRRSFDMISPYFVPGERGTALLEELAKSGVRVRVLTNSYAGTDVSVVHSGYAKRRCALARAGVHLYELKPEPDAAGPTKDRDDERKGSGSSAARLHAKTFAADDERIFVGSFNFDPRSAFLNTEMGLVIQAPVLAKRLSTAFDHLIPASSYEVRAREGEACLEWIERTDSGEVRHETEPKTTGLKRAWLDFLGALPIDWLL
ncbi:MAG: phospholipase D-like domain-containing protein [Usitatibacter sp.]